jgi:hypothetical protein
MCSPSSSLAHTRRPLPASLPATCNTMEGERAWAFAPPAWAAPPAPPAPAAGAAYLPAGAKKRRRKGRKHGGRGKRHRGSGEASGGGAGAAAAPAAAAPGLPLQPANPTQLAPLRCAWPHPAVLDLLAQQCWPAAGPAALVQRATAAAGGSPLGPQPAWWNRMLPSLSLLHPPLLERQHLELLAGRGGGSSSSSSKMQAQALPRPNLLVGYEVGGDEGQGCRALHSAAAAAALCDAWLRAAHAQSGGGMLRAHLCNTWLSGPPPLSPLLCRTTG